MAEEARLDLVLTPRGGDGPRRAQAAPHPHPDGTPPFLTWPYADTWQVTGLAALKQLSEWLAATIRIDADSKGFYLIYELLTGTLT